MRQSERQWAMNSLDSDTRDLLIEAQYLVTEQECGELPTI